MAQSGREEEAWRAGKLTWAAQQAVAKQLREQYRGLLKEELPGRLTELLQRL